MSFRPRLSRRGLRWGALAVGLYLLFLLVRLPAGVAIQWLPAAARSVALQFGPVEGSIWSGTLRNVHTPRLPLGDLHWRLSPLSLLRGRIGVRLQLTGDSGRIEGWLGYGFDGSLTASDLRGDVNLHAFDPLLQPVMLNGTLHIATLDTTFTPGRILHLDGEAEWRAARIGGVQDLALGQVRLEARPKGDGSTIRIDNQGGDLAVAGRLTLTRDGTWQLDATLQNRDATRQDLQQLLRFLGRPDSAGRYRFRQSGRLGW